MDWVFGSKLCAQKQGGSQRWCHGRIETEHEDAPQPPLPSHPLSEDAPEPQAKQAEAATFYQGTLAVETAAGTMALLPVSCRRLRGRGHQSQHQAQQAPLEYEFLPAGGGQAVVLRRTRAPRTRCDQAGLRDKSTPRAVGPQEDGREARSEERRVGKECRSRWS